MSTNRRPRIANLGVPPNNHHNLLVYVLDDTRSAAKKVWLALLPQEIERLVPDAPLTPKHYCSALFVTSETGNMHVNVTSCFSNRDANAQSLQVELPAPKAFKDLNIKSRRPSLD